MLRNPAQGIDHERQVPVTTPQDAVNVVDTSAVTDGPQYVTLSQAQLDALIAQAAKAQMPPPLPGAADPVPAAQHDEWSANHLLHMLVGRVKWFTEREERSAHAAVDTHYPAPSEE